MRQQDTLRCSPGKRHHHCSPGDDEQTHCYWESIPGSGVLDRILQDENHICVGVISRTLLQRTNKAMLRCVGRQQVFSRLGLDGPGMIWLMIKCSCQFHVGCVDGHHIMFWFWVFFSGSTIRALLHGKINPKNWQVLNLGDVGVLLFF